MSESNDLATCLEVLSAGVPQPIAGTLVTSTFGVGNWNILTQFCHPNILALGEIPHFATLGSFVQQIYKLCYVEVLPLVSTNIYRSPPFDSYILGVKTVVSTCFNHRFFIVETNPLTRCLCLGAAGPCLLVVASWSPSDTPTSLVFHGVLVGGLEHEFYLSIKLGISSSQLTNSLHHFSEWGRWLNHQPDY